MISFQKYLVIPFTLFLVLFFNTFVSLASASESIPSFHSNITINQDTSVTIEEEINYTTTLNKHGIYRYVPETFTKDGLKYSRSVTDISVTDEQSNPIQFETISDGPFLTLKIGDPDTTFSGNQSYRISYTMSEAIDQYELETDYDEFYWDITGEGWEIPIASATATIYSPHAKITDVDCFSGAIGGDDGKCISVLRPNKDRADFLYPQTISYGDNMTVALKLESENGLVFPTATASLLQTIFHNLPLAALPVPILLVFVLWYFRGRDYAFISSNVYNLDPNQPQRKIWPSLKAREPFVYAPIKELTPGQAGLLIDEKVDTSDLVAEILELARKKFLKIEAVSSTKFLELGTKTDYRFIKLKPDDSTLPLVQKYLFEHIFEKKETTLVSELKGTFYTHMAVASKKLEESVNEFFSAKPSTARGIGIAVFGVSWGITMLLLSITFFSIDIFWPLPFLLIQPPLGVLLGYNFPQKTAVGHALWLQTRGLRKSINYGKWREKIKEKNLFIEEVLPFAVALGVVDKLSKDMEALHIKPPEYLGSTTGTANSAMTMINTQAFVSSFSSSVGSELSYNPNSSSSGSGSGFSGGGGGGGGGGSW